MHPDHNSRSRCQSGVVLVLVAATMVILGVLTTAFLIRMRNSAGAADDVIRLAQNRVSLFAAITYIQESSRLGYAQMGQDLYDRNGNPGKDGYTQGIVNDFSTPTLESLEQAQPWLCAYPREGHGWVDVRAVPPTDNVLWEVGEVDNNGDDDVDDAGDISVASDWYTRFKDHGTVYEDDGSAVSPPGGFTLTEHLSSRHIGPRGPDGRILWPFRVRKMRSILQIEITNGGSGYTDEPRVTISAPSAGGIQAKARAVVRNGRVVRIEIDEPGSGYASKPTVTIAGSSGTTATADATKGAWVDPADWDNYRYVAWPNTNPSWPAPGSILRVPFHRLVRPPFAVDPTVVRNPIPTDYDLPTFGIPFRNNPDPIPALPIGTTFDPTNPSMGSSNRGVDWASGDTASVPESQNLSWFRIYRETGYEADRPDKCGPPGSTFVITVGSGGTMGYKDWAEVVSEGDTALFDSSEELFEMLLANERRHSYRIEWIGGVGGGAELLYASPIADDRTVMPDIANASWYQIMPPNGSRMIDLRTSGNSIPNVYQPAPPHPRNYIGTIRYIQRLEPANMPANW